MPSGLSKKLTCFPLQMSLKLQWMGTEKYLKPGLNYRM